MQLKVLGKTWQNVERHVLGSYACKISPFSLNFFTSFSNVVKTPTEDVYKPLSSARSTRLLYLLPSIRKDAPLVARVREADLDDDLRPVYEALSYVWGDTDPPDQLRLSPVDDTKSCTALSITPNCGQALRHLRRRFRPRTLWVDAICINQASVAERNQQVQMMGDIYARSYRVVVWMDIQPIISRMDFWLVRQVAKFANFTASETHHGTIGKVVSKVAYFLIGKGAGLSYIMDRLTRGTFMAIMANPYFDRVWTIQETAVHPTANIVLVTHYDSMPFKHLLTPLRLILDRPRPHYNIGDIKNAFLKLGLRLFGSQTVGLASLNFWRLLTIRLQAKEPRDKAYALLFTFKRHPAFEMDNDGHGLLQVNYDKSIQTVFTEFTTALIQDNNLLPVVLASQRKRMDKLPSWVPDWTSYDQASSYFLNSILLSENSSPASGSCPSFDKDKDTMQVRGRTVTSILRHVELHSDAIWEPKVVRVLGRLFQMTSDKTADGKRIWQELLELAANVPAATKITLPEEHVFDRGDLYNLSLRLDVCNTLFLSYMENIAAHGDYDDDVAADLDAWLAPIRTRLESLSPGARLDPVCAKTREFAHQSGRPVSTDSIFFTFVSLLEPHFKLSSLLRLMSVVLGSGVTAFVTETNKLGMGMGVRAGDEIVLWERCQRPVIIRRVEEQDAGNVHCSFISGVMFLNVNVPKQLGPEDLTTTFVVH